MSGPTVTSTLLLSPARTRSKCCPHSTAGERAAQSPACLPLSTGSDTNQPIICLLLVSHRRTPWASTDSDRTHACVHDVCSLSDIHNTLVCAHTKLVHFSLDGMDTSEFGAVTAALRNNSLESHNPRCPPPGILAWRHLDLLLGRRLSHWHRCRSKSLLEELHHSALQTHIHCKSHLVASVHIHVSASTLWWSSDRAFRQGFYPTSQLTCLIPRFSTNH